MNIAEAKQQVKDTIEAYLAVDDRGRPLLDAARQRPVFLVGAPGIGKTALMAQIAQELGLGLVSYSMTHHTRQSALGLPFIVHEEFEGLEYEASEYTMSEIIASVYAYMKKSGVRRGILFLDEINCVSETLYPSMLQFLQFKTFGRHAVPEGWIIACAGNPPEYNKSVHEFDVVTLDRVKKISVEPDFGAWKAYAVSKGTHPAILTFLEIKKNRFYSIEASLDGKSFVTARGWDDLSDMMGVFERLGKAVDYDLVVQYVQNEAIAREFAAYYDLFNKYRSDYQVDKILAGKATKAIRQRASAAKFDERLSLLGLLLDAATGELRSVVEREEMLRELLGILKDVKAALTAPEADLAALLEEQLRRQKTRIDTGRRSGSLSQEAERSHRRIIAALERQKALAGQTVDSQTGFAAVKADFDQMVQGLKAQAKTAGEMLNNLFAFCEEVFPEGQELLILVTELTINYYAATFISRYGCDAYFTHNQELLFYERQQEIISQLESLELN